MNSIGPVDIEFALNSLNFQAEAERMRQGIRGITVSAQQGAAQTANAFNNGFGGIGDMIGDIGSKAAIAGAVVSAAFTFKQLAQEAYEFEMAYGMAMREVQTISAATQANFEGISQAIVDMAANSKDDAITLAKAYYQIVSAGHDGAAGLELLSVASKAATAGVTDTLTAADGLTTVINAWGLSADQANSVADVMFKTVERGKTTFSQLASNIAQVAPLASANGIGLNEIFAALQTITKQGTPTAQAMTQIRSSIINMNNSLGDGWSKTMTYQEGLNKIAEMAGGSSTELKKLIPDVEGMSAVLALTGEKAKGAADDLNETTKAAGAMETAYGRMMGEAENKWSVVHNKWTREMRELGKSMKEGSSMFADFLNDLMTNEKADIIDPAAKKIVDDTAASISGLASKEEKLTAVIAKINELKSKRINDMLPNIDTLSNQQPGWLQRQAENFNAGIGLTGLTPGRNKQLELKLYNRELDITKSAEKELFDLYTKIANTPKATTQGTAEKLRALSDINKEIEAAKKNQDGSTSKKDFDDYQKVIDKLEAEKVAITGIKEKAAKKEQEAIKTTIEASEQYLAVQQKIAEKIKELDAANASKNTNEGIQLTKDIAGLEKQLAAMVKGATIKPITATIKVNTDAKDQLKPMRELSDEQRQQLELKKKQLGLDREAADNAEENKQDLADLLGYSEQFTREMVSQLGLSEGLTEALNGMVTIAADLATGNYIGAFFAAAKTGADALLSIEKKHQEDAKWYQDIYNFQVKYNIAVAEGIRLQEGSLLNSDFQQKTDAAVKSIVETQTKLAEFKKKTFGADANAKDLLSNTIVKTGVEWNWLGTESWNTYSNLLDLYPELIDANGNLNTELAKTLLSTDALWTEYLSKEKDALQGVVDYTDELDAVKKQIDEVITSLVGSMGSDLRNALVTAFEDGTSSAQAFGDTVDKVLKNIVSQMLFNTVFGAGLAKLQTEMYASQGLDADGKTLLNPSDKRIDNNWTDDIARYKEANKGNVDAYNKALAANGFTVNPSATTTPTTTDTKATGVSGSIQSATEETVGAMVGQLMAVRVDIKSILANMAVGQDDVAKNLFYMKQIADNTSENKRIMNVERELIKMNATLEARL